MAKIKGITVKLHNQIISGYDQFNAAVYKDIVIEVDNVLVVPASTDDIIDSQNLYGKKAVYNLAIPKNDKNIWENNVVEFFGYKWRVFGFAIEGINENIPLEWNKKIMVERYE